MARIGTIKEPTPLVLDRFFGLNTAKSGDTTIAMGESGNMYNCFITNEYTLKKANGYLQLMDTAVTNKQIQGMWNGLIGGDEYFLFAKNGHIYSVTADLWKDFDGTLTDQVTDLGTLTDAPTQFFAFNDKVYILNGAEYKSYDGTTLADVAGYVPKIVIGAVPVTGAGTEFENLNMLTGKKRTTYNGDATATYQLPETTIDSVDAVYVGGVLKTATTHYTVVTATGVVTFTAGNFPAAGLDNVEIYWTKGTGTRDNVVKNRFARLFGEATDTRVFLYGNADSQHTMINSSLADGVPSVEYFAAAYLNPIGSENYPITDMQVVNGNILIYKSNSTYYSYYDIVNLDGIDYVNFPVSVINATRGNKPMGQGQILNNEPFTIDYQLLKWYPTDIKDETNMVDMGQRIQPDLDLLDLSHCYTIDKQNSSELYIANGKDLYIYKYNILGARQEQGVFSKFKLNDEPTCFLFIDGDVWFGTTTGKIMRMNEDYLTFNGTTISSHWEMNMYDFGSSWLNKTLNKSWIKLAAQPKVKVSIQYVTDKNAYSTPYDVSFSTVTFDDTDFRAFTFYTNYNPKTHYLRLKAKKFLFLKMIIDNASATETFTLLELVLKAEYGNERK